MEKLSDLDGFDVRSKTGNFCIRTYCHRRKHCSGNIFALRLSLEKLSLGLRIAAAVAPATATIHCIQKRIIVRFGLCPQRRPYRQGCCKQFKFFSLQGSYQTKMMQGKSLHYTFFLAYCWTHLTWGWFFFVHFFFSQTLWSWWLRWSGHSFVCLSIAHDLFSLAVELGMQLLCYVCSKTH